MYGIYNPKTDKYLEQEDLDSLAVTAKNAIAVRWHDEARTKFASIQEIDALLSHRLLDMYVLIETDEEIFYKARDIVDWVVIPMEYNSVSMGYDPNFTESYSVGDLL